MELLFTYIIVVGLIFFNVVWKFRKYKSFEKFIKRMVSIYMADNMNLEDAMAETLRSFELRPNEEDIKYIARKIGEMEEFIEPYNVVEIFATYIDRYIRDNGKPKKVWKLDSGKLRYAMDNLQLKEKGGYFAVKADLPEEIDKKYPS